MKLFTQMSTCQWLQPRLLCLLMNVYVCVLVAQLCLILYDPRDCKPLASPVHEILQERILEWVAISFSNLENFWRFNLIVSLWSSGICFFIPLFISFFFFFFSYFVVGTQIETLRDNILLIKCLFLIEGLLCFQKLVGKKKFRTPECLNKQLDLNDCILISSLSNFVFLH